VAVRTYLLLLADRIFRQRKSDSSRPASLPAPALFEAFGRQISKTRTSSSNDSHPRSAITTATHFKYLPSRPSGNTASVYVQGRLLSLFHSALYPGGSGGEGRNVRSPKMNTSKTTNLKFPRLPRAEGNGNAAPKLRALSVSSVMGGPRGFGNVMRMWLILVPRCGWD